MSKKIGNAEQSGIEFNDFWDKVERLNPFSEADLTETNDIFENYIFYKDNKNGARECYCTHCRQQYISEYPRAYTTDNTDLFFVKHNESASCLKCHCRATAKSIKIARACTKLAEYQNIVFVKKLTENKVAILGYNAYKVYGEHWTQYDKTDYSKIDPAKRFCAAPGVDLRYAYYLTPGAAQKWAYDYIYSGQGGYKHEMRETKTITEPFNNNGGMYKKQDSYFLVGLNQLKETFLKYHLTEEYEKVLFCNHRDYYALNTPYVKYLCEFSRKPAIEVLQKHGISNPIDLLILYNEERRSVMNWQAKNPWEALRLPKTEYKAMMASNDMGFRNLIRILIIRKELKSLGVSQDIMYALRLYKLVDHEWHRFKEIVKRHGGKVKLVEKYFTNKKHGKIKNMQPLNCWMDYIETAEKIGYDLTDKSVFLPKNLLERHDDTVDVWNLMERRRIDAEKLAERQKYVNTIKAYNKKYAYAGQEYLICLPETPEEIIQEGIALRHCVGGYAQRHFVGKLAICFMRKISEPDKPFITIEMNGDKLVQKQGYRNSYTITKKEKAFINEWLDFVQSNGNQKEKIKISA